MCDPSMGSAQGSAHGSALGSAQGPVNRGTRRERGSGNIGWECTGALCQRGLGVKTAMRWVAAPTPSSPVPPSIDFTFGEIHELSSRFANCLTSLGFEVGSILALAVPKSPELFTTFLGALKAQVVVCPLFAGFGDDALTDRLSDCAARGIIARRRSLKRLAAIRSRLPALRFIIVTDIDDDLAPDVLSLPALLAAASASFEVAPTSAETSSLVHYTSGSTGRPKGVLHVHGSLQQQAFTSERILGLRPDDVYWGTADQGWVTGTSYGIIGPWSLGVTQVHYEGGFSPHHWFSLLERERVNVLYTAPTALRMLMQGPPDAYSQFDLTALRHICSVGEPLNPEVIAWGRRVLAKDIYDTWFQTEAGAILIANRPGLPIHPGSMGQPIELEGVQAAVLTDAGEGVPDGEPGHLCIRAGWPAMFRTYLNSPSAYEAKFRSGYYYTGDLARREPDGYYWFMGRCDDVINTAGHLVGPFEVESALLELEEVAEAGVIGAPDPVLFEKVVCFVALTKPCAYGPELELKLRLHVSRRVSSIATPQEIVVVDDLPKNSSGKILRRVLKARYMGVDVGDTSTMMEG